jgi:acyl transferase domain-containing protein/acyl carrier protein
MSAEKIPGSTADIRRRLDGLSPEKLRLLEKRLGQTETAGPSPFDRAIAVIGMGCRFPGGVDTPEAFWQLLLSGRDAVRKVPEERREWFQSDSTPAGERLSILRWGGFLEHVDQFDAAFFNISPREAQQMDPQQRLLLMTAWEALETAGQSTPSLAGTATGVFVGIHSQSSDYYWMQIADTSAVDTYTATGGAHSIVANRLSYFLDLRGPSLVVDTACSSSLVALHLACQSLRSQECDLALAGGVNLLLAPATSNAFSKLQFLSPEGRCRAFDAAADGFVRGEGCGVIVLRRYLDAVKRREPILAVICGSAVNQDGATNGLTAPNGRSQQTVVRRALTEAGVEPAAVTFVETHGTGTALGDPIEVEALAAVLPGRPGETACHLGAVKSNIGHLEAAAGIAGIIKTVLCLRHRYIPANLHFSELNPHIDLSATRLRIPKEGGPWASDGSQRTAGVSSFGFGGTNAHVVLREAPENAREPRAEDRTARLFCLSARSEAALRNLTLKFVDHLASRPQGSLTDLCFTLHAGRTHFAHRLAVVAESIPQLRDELRAYVDGRPGAYVTNRPPPADAASSLRQERGGRAKLHNLGAAYAIGQSIDWRTLYGDGEGEIVELPTYAWEYTRCWVDGDSGRAPAAPRRVMEAERPSADHGGDYYQVAWRPQDIPPPAATPPSDFPDAWLILNDRLGVGDHLGRRLQGMGCRCYTVEEGDGYEDLGEGRYKIAPACEDHFQRLVHAIKDRAPHSLGAVHLWGLNASGGEPQDEEALHHEVLRNCGSALLLQKCLSDPAVSKEVRIWLVTRGAQPVAERLAATAPSQAALWGFGRVVALESPNTLAGMVDLDPDDEPEKCAQRLRDILLGAAGEEQIALRGSHRYAARLTSDRRAPSGPAPYRFTSQGCYLITGGLGRLGLKLARWMAEQGAGHLVLLGRRGLAGKPAPEEIQTAQAAGAAVHLVSADVSDRQQMTDLFSRFGNDLPPLRGIIHAAGVIAPQPLSQLGVAALSSVCAAKVRGTWILYDLSRGRELDFFVLFSSAAAILGARELAHYAAANHFLDAFAHYARRRGMPMCSINWGWWAGGWQDEHLTRHFSQAGLKPVTDAAGMGALENCLSTETVQTLFADIDWPKLGPIYSSKKRRPFLDELCPAPAPSAPDQAAALSLAEALREALPDKRLKLLSEMVRGKTADLLGFPSAAAIDVTDGFFKMGMDSITAVELKAQLEAALGVTLPATAAFEYPTVTALATYLAALLSGHPLSTAASSEAFWKEAAVPATTTEREALSETELIRLLSQKVNEVR